MSNLFLRAALIGSAWAEAVGLGGGIFHDEPENDGDDDQNQPDSGDRHGTQEIKRELN